MKEMSYEEHLKKVEVLLARGIQVGDLIEVPEDCTPSTNHMSGAKHYRINFDCIIDLTREPRYIVCGWRGLIAFCDVPLKKGSFVKVVKRTERSCTIEPVPNP